MAIEIIAPYGTATVVSKNWTATVESIGYSVEAVGGIEKMPVYKGSYDIDPTTEEQTVATNGLMMEHDFIIGAIPNNYGLITYNGSVITVS